MKKLGIVHGSCRDGFCAAWVLHRKFGEAIEIHHAYYGKEPPEVMDRDVIMADFSYPRDVMERIAATARSLVVLDHHKTAEAALDGFAEDMHRTNAPVDVVFDMERSGAGIAWDYFFPGEPRPWLVDYVEDRDLWRHRLPDSTLVNAYIGILAFDFPTWTLASQCTIEDFATAGRNVRAKVQQYVNEASKNLRWVTVLTGTQGGCRVPVVNAPQVDISELLDAILTQSARENMPPCDFAVGWWQRFDGLFQFSLRSRGDFDVSEIAKAFGGGGHRNAAGFQLATLPPWITRAETED